MYVDPNKIPVEDHFPATEVLVDKYNQMSTPGPFPKHWLGFSYIRSEYFDLYQNFDDM